MKKTIALAAVAGLAAGASAQTYSQSYGVAIPDNDPNGVSVTLNVPDSFAIADLNVGVGVTHTWQGDLIISLTSPAGTVAPLLWRAGDSDGSGAGFSADNLGDAATGRLFVFDDQASDFYDSPAPNGIGNTPDPGIANVVGSWRPYGSQASGLIDTLTMFNGENSQGDWTLTISDNAGADTGTFDTLSLQFTPVPAPGALALLGLGGLIAMRRRR